MQSATLRLCALVEDSIVDGPGLRLAVFTQGCPHACEGCHNPQTHDPLGGMLVPVTDILKQIDANPLLSGITLTGGEPLLQAEACALLAEQTRRRGLSVILYTGYLWEELLSLPHALDLLRQCDWVVDGPYLKRQRSLDLQFKGSSNQRVIAVTESLKRGQAVLLEQLPEW